MDMEPHRATWASRAGWLLRNLEEPHLYHLMHAGIEMSALLLPLPVMISTGSVGQDNRFENDLVGEDWFAVEEPSAPDVVFWNPRSGQLTSYEGRAFALGEAAITDPATYSFGYRLNIFADPLEWLRSRRDGITIIPEKWPLAFGRLRDCPRIAVAEPLLPLYRQWMRPPRMPQLFVLQHKRRAG